MSLAMFVVLAVAGAAEPECDRVARPGESLEAIAAELAESLGLEPQSG